MSSMVQARDALAPVKQNRRPLKSFVKRLRQVVFTLRDSGGRYDRECPVCGFQGRFLGVGSPPRWDAQCPRCDALERHRLLYLALSEERPIADDARVLHFAAETAVRNFVNTPGRDYVTADLDPAKGDLALNIEDIALPDESFDAILCSHVLEHVDDSRALPELFRILKKGGTLYAMVPLVEGWESSYENPSVKTEAERDLHFGQWDHIRFYGRDIRDRIRKAGFELTEYTAFGENCVRYGLVRGETIFLCRRPA